MNKLRQSLRRRKPAYVPEASRPHQWQADEDAVRKGTCSFPVRVSGRGSAGRGCSWMPRADVRVRSSGCSCRPRSDVRVRSSAQGGDWDSLCGRDLTSAKNCGSCNMSAPPPLGPSQLGLKPRTFSCAGKILPAVCVGGRVPPVVTLFCGSSQFPGGR